MHAWQTTRNTYEAAALASLDIPLKPVAMRDFKSGCEYTDWNLAPNNQAIIEGTTDIPVRNSQLFITGQLRRDFNNGKPIGELATQPLHPYLIALRAMHNRNALLAAQKGMAMAMKEEAPGSYILERGTQRTPLPPFITTVDLDIAVALITVGCAIASITHNGIAHVYTLSRYSIAPGAVDLPRLDGGLLLHDLRANTIFPARRWEPFAIAIHALHCLRELRKHQNSNRYITVRHRTYTVRGAAFQESASSAVQAAVQTKLGIKL